MAWRDADSVVVAGAGIGGLAAALGLARSGLPVVVLEQAPALREVGAGLTLAPNATRALHALGLERGLAAIAAAPTRGAIRHWRTGEPFVVHDRAALAQRHGAPYLQVHRADLHALLAEALRAAAPGALRLDATFAGFVPEPDGVDVVWRRADGSRGSLRARSLVGADGARSAVRDQLFRASPAVYTGYAAWRGLAPTERLPHGTLDFDSSLYVGPERAFVRYPVRGGTLVSFVAAVREPDRTVESWSARGDPAEAASAFADFHPAVRAILAAVPADGLYKWALCERQPLVRWAEGPVGLLGDAAHPMLPFLGQGAAMALEDAVVLARAFAQESEPELALARYERARRPRASDVQRHASRRAGELLATDPDDYGRREPVDETALGLFDYDAAAVPI